MKAAAELETEFFLQWGSRKRVRCARVRGSGNPVPIKMEVSSTSNNKNDDVFCSSRIRRRRLITTFLNLSPEEETSVSPQPTSSNTRNSETATHRSESRKSSCGSPEKEERYYSTRLSAVVGLEEIGGKTTVDADRENNNQRETKRSKNISSVKKKMAWPKLCIGLSSKEKEEDFLAMKGCKLRQRPKKRPKLVQKTLILVSPGAWLMDMSLERYEVREEEEEKKTTCKKLLPPSRIYFLTFHFGTSHRHLPTPK